MKELTLQLFHKMLVQLAIMVASLKTLKHEVGLVVDEMVP